MSVLQLHYADYVTQTILLQVLLAADHYYSREKAMYSNTPYCQNVLLGCTEGH